MADMDKNNKMDDDDQATHPSMPPKLTEWEKEPTAQELQSDLEASRSAHDTFVLKVTKWNDLSEVTGSAKPKTVNGRSSVQPKLIRRQAEWRYSALTEPFNSSSKMFDVKPTTFEDAKSARQNELVLNYQFRSKLNRVNFIDNYVRANVDEGSAVVRVGWNRVTKKVKEVVPVWSYLSPQDEEQIKELEMAIQYKAEDPRGYDTEVSEEVKAAVDFFEETGQPNVAQKTGEEEIEVEKIIDNRPTLQVINLKNFYFDPSCGEDFDKASFAIFSFETSKAELMKQPKRYKNLQYVDWEGATTVGEPYHMPQSTDSNFNFKDNLRKRVVAYEYWGMWDIKGNGVLVPIVATWIGSVLVRLEENPYPDEKIPFVIVPYMPVKRQALGEPDAELLEDNQKILGAVSRGMIDLLGRSANAQQGFAKGFLDVLNRRRFESGQDYEFNPNMPPALGVVDHKYPEIPQSAMLMLQLQNQEAEALTGVKAFSGGLSGNAYGDVAAGIKGILDAASKREMSILRRLAAGLVLIGKKIIAMNAEFLSEKEVVRVTNEEFIEVKREELQSFQEFDLEVDISTAEVDNNKSQDLAFMLQTMGNNMDFNIVKMLLSEIAELKRMPDLAKKIQQFEPKPDPFDERMKQIEIQKAMKEVEKLDSEIALNKARAQKEEAMAEQGAINVLEQETGTKHARDMEKQVAQSTGNQALEVTKALLKSKKEGERDGDVEAAVGYNELSKRMREVDNRPSNPPVQQQPLPQQVPQADPRGIPPEQGQPGNINGIIPPGL